MSVLPTPGDELALATALRQLLAAFAQPDTDFAAFASRARCLIDRLRGADGYDNLGSDWLHLPPDSRRALRAIHHTLSKNNAGYVCQHQPEEVEELARKALVSLTLNASAPPSPLAPATTPKEGATLPVADPFAELRQFARKKLKGQERAVIEAVCDADGELPLTDLAVADGVDFDDPIGGFKDVKRRLKPKLEKIGWMLDRHDNAAILKPRPSAKEGLKSPALAPE